MLYVIIAHDCPDSSALRQAAQTEHASRLQALKDEARLLLAGPFLAVDSENSEQAGLTGSLIVAEFETIKQAQDWAQSDPFSLNGAYCQIEVRPFVAKWP